MPIMIIPANMPARKLANALLNIPPRAIMSATNPPISPPIRCPILGKKKLSKVIKKPTKAPTHKLPKNLPPIFQNHKNYSFQLYR